MSPRRAETATAATLRDQPPACSTSLNSAARSFLPRPHGHPDKSVKDVRRRSGVWGVFHPDISPVAHLCRMHTNGMNAP
jgi:hypothetical protein